VLQEREKMTTTHVADEWLTLQEIAADLKVPLATVYQWRSSGDGPEGHRLGRHTRVRRRDYETWLAARRDGAGNAKAG
jgi:excisionase family DNA binding protein